VSARHRLAALDGLRGIAALIVVLRHTNNAVAMPMSDRLELLKQPFGILLNAQGAVQLFFVLSGFVLAGSLSRGPGFRRLASGTGRDPTRGASRSAVVVEHIEFLVKRVFRIHLPYVVAVLFAFALCRLYVLVPDGQGLTRWITTIAALRPSTSQLLPTLAFPGTALGLVPQGWTLRVEMIFSLLMPLLLLVAYRSHWSLLLLLSVSALKLSGPFSDLRYAIDFAIGISIFIERDRIGRWLDRMPAFLEPVMVGLGLALFAAPMFLGWFYPVPAVGLWLHGIDSKSIAVMAVGSGLLIVSAIHVPWFRRALSTRRVVFLGRISFSVYLLHLTCIALLATNLVRTDAASWLLPMNGLGLTALVLLASIPISTLCYHAVERPSIRVANHLCRKLARRFQAVSVDTPL
jgi:peptidoglycan/LPS O-acetylase OafA/YrhL